MSAIRRGITTRIVVLEARPYWGPELQREFFDADIDVMSCHRMERAEVWLKDAESSILVWDFVVDRARTLHWLSERVLQDRSPRVVVCSDPENADWEWLLRSCGVISWSGEHRSTSELAGLCQRWRP